VKICLPTRTTAIATAATAITAGFVGIVSASTASADAATAASTHGLGSQATLVNGDIVQGWTVSDLKPSTDTIPYPVLGTLWEASASDEAIKGSVTPIVSDLNARTPSGQTYRALYQVATPQGVNPGILSQGQKTTGKVYFDVTDDKPNGVTYIAGGQDLASWVQSEPSQRRSGNAPTSGSARGPATAPAPAPPPAPAGGQQIPASNPATPPPAGSQGAPIPGSQGTHVPPNGPATPTPEASPAPPGPAGGQEVPAGSPETPAPAGPPASATPEGPPASPPPLGSPATPTPAGPPPSPASAGSPATPTPAGPPASPSPASSQGSAGSPAGSTG